MSRTRECWIDHIRVFACVLVVMGHLFMSMITAEIISSAKLVEWFIATIYYFHVPLFFICSGYVYQKYGRVASFADWKWNVIKKAVTLGIPYFVFSLATWVLKSVFSSAVNVQNIDLLESLFVTPVSPYWFLYILFLLFVMTPTLNNKTMTAVVAVVAVVFKVISVCAGEISVYAVSQVLSNEVWFVAGMVLAVMDISRFAVRKWIPVGCVLAAVFFAVSLGVYSVESESISFFMGILGCTATVLIMCGGFAGCKRYPVWEFLSRYTMPVFLMHTIFAAGWRSVLMKFGITNAAVHIASGLIISFVGPMVAAEIMKRVKLLDVLLNPGKYIRFSGGAKEKTAGVQEERS